MNPRSGMTIAELVTCIGVGSLLFAIALPVMQRQREAARNDVCKSNLMEIGLASLDYDAVHGQYPPYLGLPYNPGNAGDTQTFALRYQLTYSLTQLLPFVDQQDIVDQIDPFAFDMSDQTIFDAGYPMSQDWRDGIDAELPGIEAIYYQNQVALFRCPADSALDVTGILFGQHPADDGSIIAFYVDNNGFTMNGSLGVRTISNYVSNTGTIAVTDTPSNPDFAGLWGPIRSRNSDSIGTVVDGAANVILFGESMGNVDPISALIPNVRISGIGGIAIGRVDLYGITDGPDPYQFLGTAKKSHWLQFGAPHPNAVNTLRADGTVQPVTRNIQPETFGRLCGAADGQPLFDSRR